jgi:hypothetical protein
MLKKSSWPIGGIKKKTGVVKPDDNCKFGQQTIHIYLDDDLNPIGEFVVKTVGQAPSQIGLSASPKYREISAPRHC